MRTHLRAAWFGLSLLLGALPAMAIEEAPYQVIKTDGAFELRNYSGHLLAETAVDGTLEDAGDKAFNRLFGYISGKNSVQHTLPMTSPVSQMPLSQKISMTAPVGQQRQGEQWLVSFMMPAEYTMASLPKPDDPLVVLREVPARRVAAVRYSGFWSESGYLKNKAALQNWMGQQSLVAAAEPIWARYNAPFVPWFLRRNEVLIPVMP
jgi:hypothetical protein